MRKAKAVAARLKRLQDAVVEYFASGGYAGRHVAAVNEAVSTRQAVVRMATESLTPSISKTVHQFEISLAVEL